MTLALAVALIFFVILPLVGVVIEALLVIGDRGKYLPPGQLVDVGGHRLHLLCMGQDKDAPTVILDAGGGGFSIEWGLVQPAVARFARVCAYDRAGYGWSDNSSKPRSAQRIADELHMLLINAGIPAPYILAGHSIGGAYVRQFAKQFPEKVAGAVLVDSVHPRQWEYPGIRKTGETRRLRFMALLARMGLLRFAAATRIRRLNMPADVKGAFPALVSRGVYQSAGSEVASLVEEPGVDRLLGDKPLVVVSQTPNASSFSQVWHKLQADLLNLSSNSIHLIAKHSTHYVHFDEPELVIEAIRRVVDQAKERLT